MNKGIADLLKPGLDWEILMRESARRGIYADALGREDQWVADRLANGVEFIQDYELSETDGKTYLVSVHPTTLGGFVVTRVDITDKKQNEALERDSDLLVRTVLDASSAVVVMARIGDGQILYRTPAASGLFGNTKTVREHYANPEDRADLVTQLLADGQVDDYRITAINASGDEIEISISSRIVEFKGEEVIVTNVVDLTEQLEAEALIRQVLEACPVPVQMTELESAKPLFRSPETIALFGEVENSVSYYVNDEDRKLYLEELRKNSWVNDHKVKLLNAKGEEFWGAISSRLIDFEGREVIVSNTRDLTDELALQEELSSQREMLFQNEKMSALGELLAGVAHELNNPLSVVVGHSLMMREDVKDKDLARRIEKISGAAERCARIVKTFLAMARQEPTKIEQIDMNSIVATAVDVAGYGSKAGGISIESQLDDELPQIAADADQITQVIINLIINSEQAIKASGVGDRIKVETRVGKTGETIEIVIEDNGPGIPENIQARIFEPFFTTKDVGEGTGIGLAFCHRIILSHGGQIRLDPNKKQGSRFVVDLPVKNLAGENAEEIFGEIDQGANLKALVLDDEVEVGELTAEILERDGFDVEFMFNGVDALKSLENNHYDVFLTDLNMPEIDGKAIVQALKSRFPQMLGRTVIITGDTMGPTSKQVLSDSGIPHLEKPVSPPELRKVIADILNTRRVDD